MHGGAAKTFCLLFGLSCLGFLGGCGGKSEPVRNEITGKVTFGDQPIEDGVIFFEPQDGQGTRDGAQIVNGEYRISRNKGLAAGKYKVSVHAGESSAANKGMPPGPSGPARNLDPLPPEWSTDSKQFVEVKDGEPNTFNFNIPKRKT